MTKFKHTPGPWMVGPKSADGSLPIIADVTRAIGEVKNPFSRDDKGQTKANAILIAAAPELLDAVIGFVDNIDHACLVEEDHSQADLAPTLRKALLLIGSLEGGAK